MPVSYTHLDVYKRQRVLKGETLEELAEKINAFAIKGQYPSVTAENLKATIEKHNGYIDSLSLIHI